jgi:hypothetical protein
VPQTSTPLPQTSTPLPPTAAPTSVPKASTAPPAGSRPDPKADPLAALLYASAPGRMKSATFVYQVNTTLKPADEASAKALGATANQLSQAGQTMTGTGAFEVVDVAKNLANMRMTFETSTQGQTTKGETVVLDDTVWYCTSVLGCLKLPRTSSSKLTGVDPAQMLELLRHASAPVWVDENPLNGEPVHHLRYKVNKENAANLVSGLVRDAWKEMVKEMTVQVDVWMTAQDLVIRKMEVGVGMILEISIQNANPRIRGDTSMVMSYDKLNQPVKIEAPKQ